MSMKSTLVSILRGLGINETLKTLRSANNIAGNIVSTKIAAITPILVSEKKKTNFWSFVISNIGPIWVVKRRRNETQQAIIHLVFPKIFKRQANGTTIINTLNIPGRGRKGLLNRFIKAPTKDAGIRLIRLTSVFKIANPSHNTTSHESTPKRIIMVKLK